MPPIPSAGLVLDKRVVGITVEPALTWLRRGDYRMSGVVSVLRGVLVRRVIAAQRPAALLTGPEVDPPATDFDAVFAHSLVGFLDRRNRTDVSTGSGSSHNDLCR